ncbi:MAG: SurA N-terminal domain-containing protein [Nitrospirota bacterium]
MKVVARFILASVMPFKPVKEKHSAGSSIRNAICILSIIILSHAFCGTSRAQINDRVVASVDDFAITLRELNEKYAETLKRTPDITRAEVLDTMINRLLLIREADKIGLERPSEDELIGEYIDLKIRTFIYIQEKDLKNFYEENLEKFQGKDFEDVRDEIETYLVERDLNERLKKHITELREKACINIHLND